MEISPTPFYQRLSFNLISLGLLALLLYIGKSILLPFFFAILLATLLLPVLNFLLKKNIAKPIAILLPLVVSLLLFGGIIYFLSNRIVHFFDDLPTLNDKVNDLAFSIQRWFNKETSMSVYKQNKYIKDGLTQLQEKGPALLGSTVSTLTDIVSYLVLLPIYTFLVMYYKNRIKQFLISVFKNGSIDKVKNVLSECANVAQRYVFGLCIETTLVFILNTIGFLILGISYPVFLALLAALLNLIPYVGMLAANVICILITLISSDNPMEAFWVALVLLGVQFFDNNFGMPLIVGNKVKINALATILGIIVGGALCGIPGMFLAIPGLAIMKVVFDRVPKLEPWGMLLGDDEVKTNK